MKVKTKLIGLFSGLFLLGCGIAGYIGYTSTTGILEEKAKEHLESQVFHAMDKMDRMLFERYKDMQFLAADPVISSAASTPEQISGRLKELLTMNQLYLSLAFFDLKRTRIADTSGTNIGKQHPFNEFWPGIAKGKDFVLLISMSGTLKRAVLYSASVVKDKKSRPIGVVVSRISVDSLYEIIRQAAGIQPTEKESMMELVDKNGLILYSDYDKNGILKAISDDWEAIKGFVSQGKKTGSERHSYKGEDEISAFAQEQGFLDFKGNEWVLKICTPSGKAFAGILEQRNKFLVIFSAIGFIGLLSTIFLQRTVTRPLQELSMAAAEIGRGKLDIHVEVKSEDEIGHLARAFNRMADDLNNSFSELIKKDNSLKTVNINLDAANKELESFAYVVSHDLKAPLRGVASLSNWLMADYADKLDDEGRQSLSLLVSRVTRMNNMIDGILHYSRVGRIKEELVEVDLKLMLDELIDMLTVPTHIEIKVETELPAIVCEKTRIFQVFQNLLSNAVKYMDKPKGEIRVGHVDEGDFYKFYVSDNGPGIEAQYFEKIFQIFQTLKPRDELESTGVGLTIAKKIVELQGGKIWVESKPGEGSAFWFTIAKKQIEKDTNSQSEKFNVVESEGDK